MAAKKRSYVKGKGGRKGYRLPPKQPQQISLERAVDLTQRYRKSAPASEHGGFFFGDGVRAILEQPNVAGIRYYHGLDAEGRYQLVLVGVDGEGRDIVRPDRRPRASATKGAKVARAAALSSGQAVILDMHFPCPPWCDPTSPLL
ncbi:MAG: hypothetical protein ABIT38_04620 [Gemmatimonadaceae bacterium]